MLRLGHDFVYWFAYLIVGEGGSGWMMNRTKDGHKFYFNVHTMEAGWEKAAGITKDYSLLTREEMQVRKIIY